MFKVIHFNVEYKTSHCEADRLRYYNGPNTGSAQFIDFCGDFPPMIPISGSNLVNLEFVSDTSDHAGQHHGFEIIYNTTYPTYMLLNQSKEALREYSDISGNRNSHWLWSVTTIVLQIHQTERGLEFVSLEWDWMMHDHI